MTYLVKTVANNNLLKTKISYHICIKKTGVLASFALPSHTISDQIWHLYNMHGRVFINEDYIKMR